MGTFFEPPFWALPSRAGAPRMTAVLVTAPVLEVLSVEEGKLRAGLDWAPGDPRDALMLGFIKSATAKVTKDTGIVPLTATYDVFFDRLPDVVSLPWRPIQSITSVQATSTTGVVQTVDPVNYDFDPAGVAARPARLARSQAGVYPTDLQAFQPWVVRIVVGFTTLAAFAAAAPELVDAVGILVADAATAGRDRFADKAARDAYDEKIAAYQLVVVP